MNNYIKPKNINLLYYYKINYKNLVFVANWKQIFEILLIMF